MKPNPDAAPAAPRKPRLALAIATCFGLGYIPFAPGTWGSLIGVLAWYSPFLWFLEAYLFPSAALRFPGKLFFQIAIITSPIALLAITVLGVAAASRVAKHTQKKDPQVVIIDEISGQHLALLLGAGIPDTGYWKYALLGFILFRVFDIWKPFPVRQAERLPGGWGIMADDWVAAVYAALGLWVARFFGL